MFCKSLVGSKFLIIITALSLVACVTISDRPQLVSNLSLAGVEMQSCEASMLVNSPSKINREPNQGLNPDKISFLNWNIYKGSGENWKQDLSSFASEHDLMTIQEAILDEHLTGLLGLHDFSWTMHTAFHLNGTAAGVMNVSNTGSLHNCGFRVNEPIVRIPKATLVSYYSIDGSDERLLVANIHSINFTLGVESYRKQLDKLYNSIAHHNGPMIVAGDFNSWSRDRQGQMELFVNRLALREIEYVVNNKRHVFGHAIDHVFYRDLELLNNRVIQVSSSDHNPISVSFKVLSAI